jgi:hypothetical protein
LSETKTLTAELTRLAGQAILDLNADDEQANKWNKQAHGAQRRAFEYRVLVGLAIAKSRPEHGSVGAHHKQLGKRLDRSARWVRLTVLVSKAVEEAIREEVPLPMELRTVSWEQVPKAIDNLREGRSLQWKPPLQPRDKHAQFNAALASLVTAVNRLKGPKRRKAIDNAIARLQQEADGSQ